MKSKHIERAASAAIARVRGSPWPWIRQAFFFVVVCFVTATCVAEFSSQSINRAAQEITREAGPSIQHLEQIRSALLSLQLITMGYVQRASRGAALPESELLEAQRHIHDEFTVYSKLQSFEGEEALWPSVKQGEAKIDALLSSVVRQVNAHDFTGATEIVNGELATVISDQSKLMLTLINYNASQMSELGNKIERTKQRTTFLVVVLDGVCALLALLAAHQLSTASRRYTSLLEEHTLLLERRADEMEQFAGRVAHDILSPLSPIATAIELTNANLAEDDPKRLWLQRATSSLKQVKAIVDSLLSFAKAGASAQPGASANVVDIVESVLENVSTLATNAKITIDYDSKDVGEVACPPGLLASVVGNIVQNAIKYMATSQVRQISIRAEKRATCVRFEIDDTGPGFPPEMETRVFEPHVRATSGNQPGIGLGLATVRRIVEAHGGSVGARSKPGEGSHFWFELPTTTQ